MVWSYAGDALWVLALTIMFGASRQAWRRIPPGVKPPLMGVRLSRGLVLVAAGLSLHLQPAAAL